MYAIANMPEPLQVLTYLIPSRYFVAILKNIYLKGADLGIILTEAAFLVVFGIVMIMIANKKLGKRLV